mmetsp:Transcript_10921/g.24119  ORF Transcript_10921/g.24119 Transcript_10921/m.24119 type:complete len:80 (-) Transcript_10921:765-1004(-)
MHWHFQLLFLAPVSVLKYHIFPEVGSVSLIHPSQLLSWGRIQFSSHIPFSAAAISSNASTGATFNSPAAGCKVACVTLL